MRRGQWIIGIIFVAMIIMGFTQIDGCDGRTSSVESDSGIKKITAKVKTGIDGYTSEQRNIVERYEEDNKPGAIKHLYVISAYSGQVILYSTVKGKVTSSGKRLTPTTVVVGSFGDYKRDGFPSVGGTVTNEVLQDDGTYGSSIEYLFWKDEQGRYHQHYPSGGQIIHISNQPLAVKSVIINVEAVK